MANDNDEQVLTRPTMEQLGATIARLPDPCRVFMVIVTQEGAINIVAEDFCTWEIYGILRQVDVEVTQGMNHVSKPDPAMQVQGGKPS
jgi:hypothetical protein